MFKELRAKYTDNSPAKNEKLVREFHNFKLDTDETIDHAYSHLKALAREIISNNENFRSVYGPKVVYAQLLTSLPIAYDAVRDTQRQLQNTKLEDILSRLQEKETDLKDRKVESAHWSKSKSSYPSSSKSPSTHRKSLRRHSDESSDSDTSRRPRRKVRSCYLCESTKYTVSYYPLMSKAKRFVRSQSRHSSTSRSERGKLRDDRPRQEDKKVRFEKDSKSKDYKRDNQRRRDKAYMVDSDTSECQYSSSFSKDGLYAGTGDENESANYAYNESSYTPIFSHRNAAFNAEIDKFNVYRSSLTKTPIPDTHIYESDPSRATCSGTEASPNEVIQASDVCPKAQVSTYSDPKRPWMKILSQSVDSVLNVLRRPNTVKSVSKTAPRDLNLSESSVQFNHGYNTEQSQSPIPSAHSSYSARDHSHDVWIGDTGATSHMTD